MPGPYLYHTFFHGIVLLMMEFIKIFKSVSKSLCHELSVVAVLHAARCKCKVVIETRI